MWIDWWPLEGFFDTTLVDPDLIAVTNGLSLKRCKPAGELLQTKLISTWSQSP